MIKKYVILLGLIFVFSFNLNTSVNADNAEDISIILPTESIAKFLANLMPYEINLDDNFSGLFIKSIDNLKIEENKISFSLWIYGKNIAYTAKLAQKMVTMEIGSVNLLNDWESTLRFDVDEKILYIKPKLINPADTKTASYNEILINSLFIVFNDIEYPIDLKEIDPLTTEILDKLLTVKFDISNIFTANNKMTIKFRPIPHMSDLNKTPMGKSPQKK